jgi:hypothetical protein
VSALNDFSFDKVTVRYALVKSFVRRASDCPLHIQKGQEERRKSSSSLLILVKGMRNLLIEVD